MLSRRQIVKLLLIVLGGAALVAILFVIGSSLEKAEPVGGLIAEEPSGISYIDRREVLEIGGKKYVEKQGQTSFLIVGDLPPDPCASFRVS